MTQEQTNTRNMAISEFIGEKTYRPNNIESERFQIKLKSPEGKIGYWPYGHLPRFYESFDWLMLVIEKIESLNYYVLINGSLCSIRNVDDDILYQMDCVPKIEATFIACSDFAMEYNKTKNR